MEESPYIRNLYASKLFPNSGYLLSSQSRSRLWLEHLLLPNNDEDKVIYEFLDRARGESARDFKDASQASKNDIFWDFLSGNLEKVKGNFKKDRKKGLSGDTYHFFTGHRSNSECIAPQRSGQGKSRGIFNRSQF